MLTPLLRASVLLLLLTACGSVAGRATPPSPQASAPPGMAAVAHGGVRVFVPAGWPRNALRCGVPIRDTAVVDPGPVEACLLTPAPPVSYAWLRSSDDIAVDPDAAVAKQAVSLPGHTARQGEDRLPDGRTRVVLVVVDLKVVVVAVSSDPALARAIVASAAAAS